jgi:hypothetical protein
LRNYAMLAGPLYSAVARPLSVAAELFSGSRPVNSGYCPELNRSASNQYHPTECCLQQQAVRGSPPRSMMRWSGDQRSEDGDRRTLIGGQAHDAREIADFRGRKARTGADAESQGRGRLRSNRRRPQG